MLIPAFILPNSPGGWRNERNSCTLTSLEKPCGAQEDEAESDLSAVNQQD